ncbi:hypothetical protein ILUMI_20083 [Ignelater luminosus]|uniref:LITAF domain-containing protein n=1 Tax=Ignelater luminosus TaxID=2038154 RepID=A0A8K0CJ57_IGNLU|nr:hypothetical protein ILUMI_20083 [Ignelater luminosus]
MSNTYPPPPPPYSPPGVAPPIHHAPPPGFAPPGQPIHEVHFHPPAENTVIITNGPMMVTSFGPCPQYSTCPFCHHAISTRVETEPSTKTHLVAFFMCLFGCWPCCLLPYCFDSCQSKNHYCPYCGAFLGSYDD